MGRRPIPIGGEIARTPPQKAFHTILASVQPTADDTEDKLIATDFFGAGNLVVKIHYFKLESAVAEGGMRKYSLKEEERMIAVSSLIRLSGLRFSPAAGGPAGRELRSGVTKFYFLGRDTHHAIEACCVEPEA